MTLIESRSKKLGRVCPERIKQMKLKEVIIQAVYCSVCSSSDCPITQKYCTLDFGLWSVSH